MGIYVVPGFPCFDPRSPSRYSMTRVQSRSQKLDVRIQHADYTVNHCKNVPLSQGSPEKKAASDIWTTIVSTLRFDMATTKPIPTPSNSTSTPSIDWYNTPATSAPQGYTSNLVSPPSISYKITICNSICAVVIITCVALRIASRMFIVKKLGSDDCVFS